MRVFLAAFLALVLAAPVAVAVSVQLSANASGGGGSPTTAAVTGADLSVTKNASASRVEVGDDVTYTITVTNQGPDRATGGRITDALPAGVTFVSASSGCTYAADTRTVTCNLGNLNAGASATRSIVVDATEPGEVTNTANATSNVADPDATDNSDSATTSVVTAPPAGLTCVADGTAIRVSWTAVDDATGYNVYRASGGGYLLVGTTTSTTFNDTTVAPGGSYTYRVTADSAGGESDPSETCEATAVPFFGSIVGIALALAGSIALVAKLRRR